MSDDVTPRFFHWMEAHNVSRSDAASMLGVDERSLSNYRSRGLPRKKQARAKQIMAEKAAIAPPAATTGHLINVEFNDEDFSTVEEASVIVRSTIRDFIIKSTVTAAREEIEKAEENSDLGDIPKGYPPPFELPKVAEDPIHYRVGREKHQ